MGVIWTGTDILTAVLLCSGTRHGQRERWRATSAPPPQSSLSEAEDFFPISFDRGKTGKGGKFCGGGVGGDLACFILHRGMLTDVSPHSGANSITV